jgi:hypothetical protein
VENGGVEGVGDDGVEAVGSDSGGGDSSVCGVGDGDRDLQGEVGESAGGETIRCEF